MAENMEEAQGLVDELVSIGLAERHPTERNLFALTEKGENLLRAMVWAAPDVVATELAMQAIHIAMAADQAGNN